MADTRIIVPNRPSTAPATGGTTTAPGSTVTPVPLRRTQVIPDKPTSTTPQQPTGSVVVDVGSLYPPASAINAAAKNVEVTLQSVSATDQIIPVLYGYPHYLGVRFTAVVVDVNGNLHLGGLLGYGQLRAIDQVYIDDAAFAGTSSKYFGTATQGIDSGLAFAYQHYGITYADTMHGFAYVTLVLTPDLDIQNFPNVAVKCGGKQILDMRTGTTATAVNEGNPVLCLADYISNSVYGLGGQYDVASFSAAADFNDEATTDGPRYRMALALTSAQKVSDWLNQIVAYTGCLLWRRAGVYYLTPLRARSTSQALTKANIIRDSFDMQLRSQRDLPTRVSVGYTDWTTFPPSSRTAMQPNDGSNNADDRESAVALPGVTSYAMASRIAGRRLNQIWYGQLVASWKAFDDALNYRLGDVLTLAFPEYGLASAHFTITGLSDNGFGRWGVQAESYDPASFANNALPPPPILNPGDVIPPTNIAPNFPGPITLVEELVQFSNGDFRPRLRVTWPDSSTPSLLSFYSVEIYDVTASIVVEMGNVPDNLYISNAVTEQHTYRAYVVAVGVNGLTSVVLTSADVLVQGKTAPPSNVSNFVAIEAGGNVYCSWSPITDLDRDEYEIRRGTVGQAWAAMVVVAKLHATNTVLNSQPVGTVDYAIKAKDTTGHYSAVEARQTVVVTQDQNLNITGPNLFAGYTTSNCSVWTPLGSSQAVMVNTDLAGLWADGATDPNNNTGTFNDVLKDVEISSPNNVAAFMQSTPYDFGAIIQNTRVSCTAPYTLLEGPGGGVTFTVEASTDGTTYNAVAANAMVNVRYVRCRLNMVAGTSIRSVQNWTVSLVAVLVTEQGNVSIGATGKATITLANRYSSWVAIQVTPQGNSGNLTTATYDNVIVGTGVTNTFDAWLFKANAPAAGTASWSFRGTK